MTTKYKYNFNVISLMPEMFDAFEHYGVVGRAFKEGLVKLNLINPRDFTQDTHRTVDDRPFGGGPGMVMTLEPLISSIKKAKSLSLSKNNKVIHLSPRGQLLTQKKIDELLELDSLTLISSRYEGVDERLSNWFDEELSIGDYVTSGGELPAMVVIDSLIRQIPGVLNDSESASQDSFVNGLLDHPSYTRPETYEDFKVPEALLTGDHEKIRVWRLKESIRLTLLNRPELLAERLLTKEESRLLDEVKKEQEQDTL